MSLPVDLTSLRGIQGAEREAALGTLEKQLLCPICLEIFTKPVVILPCQHNLCRKCANELYQPSLFQARTTMLVNSGRFRCPSCRQEVVLDRHGVYGLQRNLLVENIIDIYKQELSSSANASPAPVAKSVMEVKCPDHQGERLNIYCLTCKQPTCSLCKVFGSHQLCQVAPLTDIYQQQKGDLEQELSSLIANNDRVRGFIDELELTWRNIEENYKSQKQSLCAQFDTMLSILEERHKVMTQQITSEEEEKTGYAQSLIRCYGDSVEANSKLLETATSTMKEPDMATFVQSSKELISKLTAAASFSPSKTLRLGCEEITDYSFNFSHQERVLRSVDFTRVEKEVTEDQQPEPIPYPEEPNTKQVPYPEEPNTKQVHYPEEPDPKQVPYPEEPDPKQVPYPEEPDLKQVPYPEEPDLKQVPYPEEPDLKQVPYPEDPDMKQVPYPEEPNTKQVHYPEEPDLKQVPYPEEPDLKQVPYPDEPDPKQVPYPEEPDLKQVPYPDEPDLKQVPYPEEPDLKQVPYPEEPDLKQVPYPEEPDLKQVPYPEEPDLKQVPYPEEPDTKQVPYPEEPDMKQVHYPEEPDMKQVPYPEEPDPQQVPYPEEPDMKQVHYPEEPDIKQVHYPEEPDPQQVHYPEEPDPQQVSYPEEPQLEQEPSLKQPQPEKEHYSKESSASRRIKKEPKLLHPDLVQVEELKKNSNSSTQSLKPQNPPQPTVQNLDPKIDKRSIALVRASKPHPESTMQDMKECVPDPALEPTLVLTAPLALTDIALVGAELVSLVPGAVANSVELAQVVQRQELDNLALNDRTGGEENDRGKVVEEEARKEERRQESKEEGCKTPNLQCEDQDGISTQQAIILLFYLMAFLLILQRVWSYLGCFIST